MHRPKLEKTNSNFNNPFDCCQSKKNKLKSLSSASKTRFKTRTETCQCAAEILSLEMIGFPNLDNAGIKQNLKKKITNLKNYILLMHYFLYLGRPGRRPPF